MSFRQDKLILLLDTGTSTQVRRTAAKQLAELTVKAFNSTITPRPVVEDVKPDITNTTEDTKFTLSASATEEDAWNAVLETVSKILPLLRSKSSETRHAASNALGLLAQHLPSYTLPVTDPSSSTSKPIDLVALLKSENTLLASAGREYIAKPVNAADKAKRRKAMMGSLGLGDAVGWGDDVEKVIGDEDEEMPAARSREPSTPAQSTPPAEPPKDIFEGLSARQVTMLKRKKGNIVEEANKLRRLNASTGSGAASMPSSAAPTPESSPTRKNAILPPETSNGSQVITIDPGAKARAAANGGGAIEPELDSEGNPISSALPTISLVSGSSPWMTILEETEPGLQEPMWQIRHGSALSCLEIVRHVGSDLPLPFLLGLARSLLALLVLDRFGDFVGDTVMAPVRETAAQALGVLLKYLDNAATEEVHNTLVQMVKQSWTKRGKEAANLPRGEKFAWEVRHAGLLGLKYEVAVRRDLLGGDSPVKSDEDVKPKIEENGNGYPQLNILTDVVEAAVLAMRDVDDDVRSVAADTLVPITEILASTLPGPELSALLDTLWDCLTADTDDLGSSTGSIMDLLGAMITHKQVITEMSTDGPASRSRLSRISRMYPYLRHTIPGVRLAVAKALHTFATVPGLPRDDWMHDKFFSLMFQNLVLEERADIRNISFAAFQAGIQEVDSKAGALNAAVGGSLEEWYEIVMTPIGTKLDDSLFVKTGKGSSGHNVDKPMMAGDLSLVSMETMLETRISAAKALASLRQYKFEEVSDVALLKRYLKSASAHQIFLASVIIQEWATEVDSRCTGAPRALGAEDDNGRELASILVGLVENPLPATYHEMSVFLRRVQAECQALVDAFHSVGGVSKDKIPTLPTKIDPSMNSSSVFSLSTAQTTIGPHFDALSKLIPKSKAKTAIPALQDRQRKVMASIGYFGAMKERYDVQVSTAVCGALIALRVMPAKFGPVVKNVMDGVKKEENEVLQIRAAASVASFVEFCNSPLFSGKNNPSDKVIKNLFTFLCQDITVTPIFAVTPTATEGILSLKEDKPVVPKKTAAGVKEVVEETDEQIASRLTRRGALEAFRALAKRFGQGLFDQVPRYWEGISLALVQTFTESAQIDEVDQKLSDNITIGQDLIDTLTSLRFIAPELESSLQAKLSVLLPHVVAALSSSYTVVRSTAAKCLAALCDVITEEGMRFVVDNVVSLVGDARRTASRQGAVEAIHHIIRLLDIKVLPYVLFLIVPILGRMSDPDESTRLLSTSTFASLVKMVPLEAGIPDPPGFSQDLLSKRDEERKFLMQLLDGSKAEQYEIPIDIKADLRQYQRDGVSWLAFLAKYQLHGILCDDMGLGKSLQSICIVGSKHHERAAKHKLTGSVDSAHLPSLIVCPPTLTGHWYYEILKFTEYLRPMQYTGSQWERATLRSKLTSPNVDVVIASYESVRADIAELSKINWLYCVLDEGHIIKNAKTKLSAAVKQLKAQHRLLLSGTPIQNNVLELWSLFDFLMPGFLGSERAFNDKFSKPILADRDGKATPKERDAASAALEALHKQVLPFLLRRMKEDVLHDLPPKIIQDYYCELSTVQKALYDEFSKSRAAEEAGEAVASEGQPGQGHVFQSLQYLRKLCNHPSLVLDGPEGQARWGEVTRKVGENIPPIQDISHAPKLEALRQLLTDCGIGLPPAGKLGTADETPQHRVLIFCQLRPMLDLIERDLFAAVMPSVRYMRMDGSTDPKKRHAVVQTFNADARIDVLLLTTSVGGLGLNLTGADTVIFVDHDWNPMKDLQAMDRAHRLGQKKVVNVYRLITRGTLEEKIMGLQRFKLNIASSVVTQQNAGLGSMNTGEVLDLFKISSEPEALKAGGGKATTGPVSASKVLEGLEDLPPEDEYAELSLSNFMSKV